MDRNAETMLYGCYKAVALRKESVDRNFYVLILSYEKATVALRKESVDRNPGVLGWSPVGLTSLSARRAWIEMLNVPLVGIKHYRSLSARRAWIEMTDDLGDRLANYCRSPQGERG